MGVQNMVTTSYHVIWYILRVAQTNKHFPVRSSTVVTIIVIDAVIQLPRERQREREICRHQDRTSKCITQTICPLDVQPHLPDFLFFAFLPSIMIETGKYWLAYFSFWLALHQTRKKTEIDKFSFTQNA